MKIGSSDPQVLGALTPSTSAPAGKATARSSVGAGQPEASVQVRISTAATQLQEGDAGQGFDAAKVAKMADAIRNGSFKPDAGAIADGMLARGFTPSGS